MKWKRIAETLTQLKSNKTNIYYIYVFLNNILLAYILKVLSSSLGLLPDFTNNFLNIIFFLLLVFLLDILTKNFDFPQTNLNKSDIGVINFLLLPIKTFLLTWVFGILIMFVNEMIIDFGLQFSFTQFAYGYLLMVIQMALSMYLLKKFE